MKASGSDPLDVDTVVLTHLHGDHFGGLPFLVLDAQFRRRTRPLRVAGPPGTAERLTSAMEALYPGSSTVQRRFELDVVDIAPDGPPQRLGDLDVRGIAVDHASGAPSLGVQVTVGRHRVAYSGDTAWTPALPGLSRDCDLLLLESYTWERSVRYHLSHREIEANLTRFEAGRVMLTHMSPDMLEHLQDACAPTLFDGQVLRL